MNSSRTKNQKTQKTSPPLKKMVARIKKTAHNTVKKVERSVRSGARRVASKAHAMVGLEQTGIASTMRGNIGSQKMPSAHGCTITRKEVIGIVSGSSGFTTQVSSLISPTNSYLFPWLSQIASAYDQYTINSMKFTFNTFSGEVTTTQNQGVVLMAIVYDPDESVPATYTAARDYSGSVAGVTYKNLAVSYSKKNSLFSTQYIAHPSVTEQATISPGYIQVWTENQPSVGVIGELIVEYSITFRMPRVNVLAVFNSRYQRAVFNVASWNTLRTASTITSITTGWPLATSYLVGGSGAGINVLFSAAGTYTVKLTLWSRNTSNVATVATTVTSATANTDLTFPDIGATRLDFVSQNLTNGTTWTSSASIGVSDLQAYSLTAPFTTSTASVTFAINNDASSDPATVYGEVLILCTGPYTTANSNSLPGTPSVGAVRHGPFDKAIANFTDQPPLQYNPHKTQTPCINGKDEVDDGTSSATITVDQLRNLLLNEPGKERVESQTTSSSTSSPPLARQEVARSSSRK